MASKHQVIDIQVELAQLKSLIESSKNTFHNHQGRLLRALAWGDSSAHVITGYQSLMDASLKYLSNLQAKEVELIKLAASGNGTT